MFTLSLHPSIPWFLHPLFELRRFTQLLHWPLFPHEPLLRPTLPHIHSHLTMLHHTSLIWMRIHYLIWAALKRLGTASMLSVLWLFLRVAKTPKQDWTFKLLITIYVSRLNIFFSAHNDTFRLEMFINYNVIMKNKTISNVLCTLSALCKYLQCFPHIDFTWRAANLATLKKNKKT